MVDTDGLSRLAARPSQRSFAGRQRLHDRVAALLSIALLAGLGGLSYYLAESAARADRRHAARAPVHEPDYFVEGFAITRTNARGEPGFRMSAARMNHYPDDDSVDFDRPVLVSLAPDKPVLTVRADRGHASSGAQRTNLHGNVLLTRAADAAQPELRIASEHLLLLPDEDIARTDLPVRITHGASSLTGEGMEFDNSARVLQVRSKVQGVWAPPAQR